MAMNLQNGLSVTFAVDGPYRKLWTGKLTNQSSRTMSAI